MDAASYTGMSAASLFYGLVALALAVWFGWKLREKVALYRACDRATQRAEKIAAMLTNGPPLNDTLRAGDREPACASPDAAAIRGERLGDGRPTASGMTSARR